MNPADLHRIELPNLDATPPLSAKALPGSAILPGKNAKLPTTIPRIDTEPIYAALKAAIGEHWTDYKTALSSFLLGKLNQAELTRILTPILSSSTPSVQNGAPPVPSAAHLHNTLLTSLYANALYRDPPPETTASWVLATDAPSSSTTKTSHTGGANDKIDDRNRREVMALAARDRRRIKSVKDPEASAQLDHGLHQARRYHEALDALPSSVLHGLGVTGIGSAASVLSKTNTDLEIRRRFALPLAAETEEFPSRENIASRIEPICYEEGLTGAIQAGQLSTCAELVETALETFVKELVGEWIGTVREDADGLVQPRRFKRRLRAEERAEDRGEIERDAVGRLPVEIEACNKRAAIGPADLRLAVQINGGMPHVPFLANRWIEDGADGGDAIPDPDIRDTKVNGVNGFAHPVSHPGDEMDIDGDADMEEDDYDASDWGWHGGARTDRSALLDVLSGALAVGS
ncbi:hypothetical protein K461DRAFT_290149 [Myriangium duriaei CBS 260.36]|uniref:Transcriptional coactivator HFI1/ADA1 n=1 Tax=Myriangium duriaei CBS 260.36 TaxID=1168546 RepID=A0A9P4JF58_9PEZI|nr:hypothetical protein K461DRAFT_290149 [Myriangium duriaei CBS 260.36]